MRAELSRGAVRVELSRGVARIELSRGFARVELSRGVACVDSDTFDASPPPESSSSSSSFRSSSEPDELSLSSESVEPLRSCVLYLPEELLCDAMSRVWAIFSHLLFDSLKLSLFMS